MSKTQSSLWRRFLVLALSGAAVVAMIGPASASAGWYTIDDLGNTTPAGHGDPPPVDVPEGGGDDDGGGVIATEATWTMPTSSGSCLWTVRGRVIVRNPTLRGLVDGEPVEGIEVKVSGRSKFGATFGDAGYNSWGTDTTDADGEFSVTETVCDDRRVKVEARFDSDDLRVLGPTSPTWYELHDTLDEEGPKTLDLNGEPFGGESGDQSTSQARTDAQTWILYRRAIDYVTSLGKPFLNDTVVHNPATLAPDGSWADPILHDIHIAPESTNSRWTMLHELGHAWAYPREKGEGCLTNAIIADQNTHDFQENPCVAFNEGFADFFGTKLEQEMYENDLIVSLPNYWSTVPDNRAALISSGLISLDRVSKNEWGWDNAFDVLTSPDVTRLLFGTGVGAPDYVGDYNGPLCGNRGVPTGQDSLWTGLMVVGEKGDEFDLQDSDEPSVADFFDRAAARLGTFDSTDAIRYTDFVDPQQDVEPHEAYGC